MRSNNPVFARSEGFNGRGGQQTQTQPNQWTVNLDPQASTQGEDPYAGGPVAPTDDRMTVDLVVEKTAITLGLVVITAALTWFLTPDLTSSEALSTTGSLAMGGAIVGLVLGLVTSFRRIISPGLVIAYALIQGVFLGAFSKVIAAFVGAQQGQGVDATVVFQAVMATMVAFGATLFVYKFFNIQVTSKFRKVVTASVLAFLGVIIVNFLLSITGVLEAGGLRGFNTFGLIISLVAVVLAVLCLVLDFDFVERGVAAGLPARESWRAAFGLTVTIIWLYIEMIRIIAILRGD